MTDSVPPTPSPLLVEPRARVLAIGGLDPSGAAGILADVKTCERFGTFGCGVATAVTAQNAHGVSDVMSIPASLVGAQIDSCLGDAPCDVLKTGMLATVDVVHAVADRVQRLGSSSRLVVDPVLVSSSGRSLLGEEGRRALVQRLLPMAALVTPNLDEAEALTGRSAETEAERSLLVDYLLAMGASAVLLKGGHLMERDPDSTEVTDLLRTADGEQWRFSRERVSGPVRRGTGCTLASAIACGLAEGLTLRRSVERATDFVATAMAEDSTVARVRALNLQVLGPSGEVAPRSDS